MVDDDQDMLKTMERKLGKRKAIVVFAKLMPQIYNNLCKDCKAKVLRNPKVDIKSY